MEDTVEIRLLSQGRAAGSVSVRNVSVRWTAIEGEHREWFIVLHDEVDKIDASLLRLLVATIERNLVARAA